MTCIEDNLEQWRICDQFSVVQAALLFLGLDPSIYETKITLTPHSENPEKFDAVFKAISDAVENGLLPAKWVSHDLSSFLVIGSIPDEKSIIEIAKPDWFKTFIKVEDLKKWLQKKMSFQNFTSLTSKIINTIFTTYMEIFIPLNCLRQLLRGRLWQKTNH